MRTLFLNLTLLLLNIIPLSAQQQNGVVKTAGRPEFKGRPIKGVIIQAVASNATLSDSVGHFAINLSLYKEDEPYCFSRISKKGYMLADNNLIGRQLPYSKNIPVEVSMISIEEYNKLKQEIEDELRARYEKEYQAKLNELEQNYESKLLTDEEYSKGYIELDEGHSRFESQLKKTADFYARIDYDKLDSIDAKIESLIERGELDEAAKLIDDRRALDRYKDALKKEEKEKKEYEQQKQETAKLRLLAANECRQKYDIAILKCDNKAAAAHLKERMLLDTTVVEWAFDYAKFVYLYLGEYEEALGIFHELLNKSTSSPSFTSAIYGCIGNVYEVQGEYDKALQYYFDAAKLRDSNALSKDKLALSYGNIAHIYFTKEQIEEGRSYMKMAEQIYMELNDSLGLAQIYADMAVQFSEKGEFNNSEEYFNKALRIRRSLLGENHMDVASVYANKAILSEKLANYDCALIYIDSCLCTYEKKFGANHPLVANGYITKADILKVQAKDYDGVLEYYNKAREIFKEYFNEMHPDVATLYNKFALYYSSVKCDYAKALEYNQKAAEINGRIFGKNHSSYPISMNNIAANYSSMARYDKAMEYYWIAMEATKLLFGENHYAVGDCYNNLASLCMKEGNYSKAKNLFLKALEIYIKHYGELHPNVALVYSNLGTICDELGEDEKALSYLTTSSNIYIRKYGENHPRIATVYNNIGAIYWKQNKYELVEEYLVKALHIRENIYEANHEDIATSYCNLGTMYINMKKYNLAEEFLKKALDISQALYGDNHPNVATIYSSFSTLYRNIKDYDRAIEFAKKALTIVESVYDNPHPTVALYKYGLARFYYDLGRYYEALPLLYEVHRIAREGKIDGVTEKELRMYFHMLHMTFFGMMADKNYKGEYLNEYTELIKNTIIIAKVAEESYAENLGLKGECLTVVYEDWNIADEKMNFFVHNVSVKDKENKSCVIVCGKKYYPITYKGSLGVRFEPQYIDEYNKKLLIEAYKKWNKKK